MCTGREPDRSGKTDLWGETLLKNRLRLTSLVWLETSVTVTDITSNELKLINIQYECKR